jgi:hypothetical protein
MGSCHSYIKMIQSFPFNYAIEPAHFEPAHFEPAHFEPAHFEPAHVELLQFDDYDQYLEIDE